MVQISRPEAEEGNDQRRDALLLRALKTAPQPRPKRDRSTIRYARRRAPRCGPRLEESIRSLLMPLKLASMAQKASIWPMPVERPATHPSAQMHGAQRHQGDDQLAGDANCRDDRPDGRRNGEAPDHLPDGVDDEGNDETFHPHIMPRRRWRFNAKPPGLHQGVLGSAVNQVQGFEAWTLD